MREAIHAFLKWLARAVVATAFGVATLAVGIAAVWPAAAVAVANAWARIRAALNEPLTWAVIIPVFLLWLVATFWSGMRPKGAVSEPARDPDGLYQLGRQVGAGVGIEIRLGQSAVFFRQILTGGEFDDAKEFEFRDFRLRLSHVDAMARAVSAGIERRQLHHATCTILGTRN